MRYVSGSGRGGGGAIPVLGDPHGLLPDGVQAINTESLFLSPTLFAQAVLGNPSQDGIVEAAIRALPHATIVAPASR